MRRIASIVAVISIAAIFLAANAHANIRTQPHQNIPSGYPENCAKNAAPLESVAVKFDTTSLGLPFNIEVVESTNDCFNNAAKARIRDRRFGLVSARGGSAAQQNAQATLTFQRTDAVSAPDRQLRRGVKKRLDRVRRLLAKDDDPKKALAKLQKIKNKYGDTFSAAEYAAYEVLCAIAHYDAGAHEDALEALRAAQETQLGGALYQSIDRSIDELQRMLDDSDKVAGL